MSIVISRDLPEEIIIPDNGEYSDMIIKLYTFFNDTVKRLALIIKNTKNLDKIKKICILCDGNKIENELLDVIFGRKLNKLEELYLDDTYFDIDHFSSLIFDIKGEDENKKITCNMPNIKIFSCYNVHLITTKTHHHDIINRLILSSNVEIIRFIRTTPSFQNIDYIVDETFSNANPFVGKWMKKHRKLIRKKQRLINLMFTLVDGFNGPSIYFYELVSKQHLIISSLYSHNVGTIKVMNNNINELGYPINIHIDHNEEDNKTDIQLTEKCNIEINRYDILPNNDRKSIIALMKNKHKIDYPSSYIESLIYYSYHPYE